MILGKKYGSLLSLIPHQAGENSSVVLSDAQSGLLVLTDRPEGGLAVTMGNGTVQFAEKILARLSLRRW